MRLVQKIEQSNKIQELAKKINSKKRGINGVYRKREGEPEEVFFDPASIILIVKILTDLVRLAQVCSKTPEDVDQELKGEVSHRTQNSLKRITRRRMGWWKYWNEGEETVRAILQTGKEENIKTLW